jgi:hypothetical protein
MTNSRCIREVVVLGDSKCECACAGDPERDPGVHGDGEELPHVVLGARQGLPHALPRLAERAHGPAHDQPRDLAVGECQTFHHVSCS